MRLTGLLLASLLAFAPPARADGQGEGLVAVELYTSQGCGGCQKAAALAAELAGRDDVLLLSFGVDYWNYLGWRDTAARPEFSQRQRAYTGRLQLANRHPYTPQMVVDGHLNGDAFNPDFIRAAIKICIDEGHISHGPHVAVSRTGDQLAIEIGAGQTPEAPGDVWLVAFQPGEQDVVVDAGENAGRVVKSFNVVRGITRLGAWSGAPARFTAAAEDGLSYAVLVQRPELGGMLATASEQPAG